MIVLGIDPGPNTTGYGVLDFVDSQPRLIEAGDVWGKSGASLEEQMAAPCGARHDIMLTEE